MNKSRHTLSLRAWIGLTCMAIAGLAVCMGLWLKPQWEEAAGGWTPLNEAIAGRLAAAEESGEMAERTASSNDASDSPFPGTNSGRGQDSVPAPNSGQRVNRGAGDPNQAMTMGADKERPEPGPGEQGGAAPALASEQKEAPAAAPSADAKAKTAASGRININEADAEGLMKLPGIGPGKSQAIVKYRESHGPFQRLEDLKKVKGIGPAIFAKLRDQASIE